MNLLESAWFSASNPLPQLLGYSLASTTSSLEKIISYFRTPSFLLTSFTFGSRWPLQSLSFKKFGIFATSLLHSPNDRFMYAVSGVDLNIKGPGRWSIESLHGGALWSRKTVNQIEVEIKNVSCLQSLSPCSVLISPFFRSRFF